MKTNSKRLCKQLETLLIKSNDEVGLQAFRQAKGIAQTLHRRGYKAYVAALTETLTNQRFYFI